MFCLQHLPHCGTLKLACVTKALEVDFGCQVKCDGLYADVWYSEEDNQVPDKIENGDAALLNMLKDGELFHKTIVPFRTSLFSVVNNIPMRDEDRQARLGYILKSTIARSSLESDHRLELSYQMEQYEDYKRNYARDIYFDPTVTSLSKKNFTIALQNISLQESSVF